MKAPSPCEYPDFAPGEQENVKALMGDARYKQAMDWILTKACGLRDLSYRPDSARDTDFAEGKRFVALQIVRAAMMPVMPKPEPQRRRSTKGA